MISAVKTVVLVGLVGLHLSTETLAFSKSNRAGNSVFSDTNSSRFDYQYLSSSSLVGRDVSTSHVTVSAPDVTSRSKQSDSRLASSSTSATVDRSDVPFTENSSTGVELSFQTSVYSSVDTSKEYFKTCVTKRSSDARLIYFRIENVTEFTEGRACTVRLVVLNTYIAELQAVVTGNMSCQDFQRKVDNFRNDEPPLLFYCVVSEDVFSFSNTNKTVRSKSKVSNTLLPLVVNVSTVSNHLKPRLEIKYTTATQGMLNIDSLLDLLTYLLICLKSLRSRVF